MQQTSILGLSLNRLRYNSLVVGLARHRQEPIAPAVVGGEGRKDRPGLSLESSVAPQSEWPRSRSLTLLLLNQSTVKSQCRLVGVAEELLSVREPERGHHGLHVSRELLFGLQQRQVVMPATNFSRNQV